MSKNHEGHNHNKSDSNHASESQHEGEHAGHEQLFRRKFWISLILSIPVLIFSKTIQGWLGYSIPDFPLSDWIVPVFSLVVFYIGGLPFFRMAKGDPFPSKNTREREPFFCQQNCRLKQCYLPCIAFRIFPGFSSFTIASRPPATITTSSKPAVFR